MTQRTLTRKQKRLLKRIWLTNYEPDYERHPHMTLHMCINVNHAIRRVEGD